MSFYKKTLPKAQQTRGLSSSNFLRPYHKFKHKSWSNSSSESRLSINFSAKHQHLQWIQNSKSWPNLASESRPSCNLITSSIKFTKQELGSKGVSEWVSHWQAFPMIGLGSDKKNSIFGNNRDPWPQIQPYPRAKSKKYNLPSQMLYSRRENLQFAVARRPTLKCRGHTG